MGRRVSKIADMNKRHDLSPFAYGLAFGTAALVVIATLLLLFVDPVDVWTAINSVTR